MLRGNWKIASKEALKSICLECEREKGKNKIACPFRSISNEYCEEYDTIEKDLERLESLEKQNELLKKDLKEYQAYIKKSVEEHYKDFMSDYDLLLQECHELNKKLKILEDIEEELGIDLIKSIELCKQANIKKVVYIKDEWGIYPIKFLDDLDVELFSHRLYKNIGGFYVSLDLYDYGKTWALTKEELENDN